MQRNQDLLITLAAMLLIVWCMSYAQHEDTPPAPCLHTTPEPLKRPVLTEAIGRVESGMNPRARGKHGERGAWQVTPRIWGKVPHSLTDQARQHERILDELIHACGERVGQAIERYNGSGPAARRYAGRVRRIAIQIALLEPTI